MPLIYDELWSQARRYLRHERPNHTLQPTALIHEAFFKLIDQPACPHDPELQQEIESLLAAHDAAGTFIETPALSSGYSTNCGSESIGDPVYCTLITLTTGVIRYAAGPV